MQITIFDKNMKKLTALNNSYPQMLHFYNDSWHSYLFEGTETFDFTIPKFSSGKLHKDIQLINDGCVIHFKADGKNHLFKVQTLTEDDFNIQLTCDTSILEYTNEQIGAFTNTEAHDIVWYLEKLDLLAFAGTRIGLNEVSNYNRTLSFEGEETKLSRLKSVISQFDAEFDFDIELNSDGSFKGYILDIYHEADDSHHGIGKVRGDVTLRYGRDVKGVQRVSDSTELFNTSVFTGKDGLSLNDYERSDKDANGNEEFYTRKGSPAVYAPKSAELYPATLSGSDKWTRKDFQTDYENINDLAAHAFKTLKQYAYPKITYTASIQSSFLVGGDSLALGDTVKIYDDNFSDGLILEARVSEKIVSFSNPNNNSIVFSNYKKLTSEISDNLKHRMAAMIEDKMPYAIKLSSNNGLFFKNNKGNTTVSATLVKGTKIIPADWKWMVNEQILSSTDTVTIEASAFEKSLTVTVKAINDKTEVASDQIIFTNVNDGAGVKKITTLTKTSSTADISKTGTFTKSAKNPSKSEPYIIGYTETELTDGTIIESDVQVVAERDRIFDDIDSQFAEATQQITEQQQAHDRTVAEILSQVDSTQSLAEQAKAIGDQAKADAVNLASQLSTAKTALQNSVNDTKSQIATVSQALSTAKSDLQTQVNAVDAKAVQAQTDVDGLKTKAETIKNDLNTAKSELQTQVNAADAKAVQAQRDITQAKSDLQSQASQLITQAAKQAELTKLTTETKKLADGTLTSLNELSKTVDKNTGNITSVANRTKTVEDSLAGVKTNYTQLNQTVNAQTGQIDSINRKTADLENGISGVKERFESLQVGNKNYLPTSRIVNRGCTNFRYNETSQSWSMTVPTGATTGFGYGITFNTSGLNILLNGGETLFFGLMIKANKACSFNYDINNALSGSTSNDNDDRSKQAWSPSNKSLSANVWTRVWFSYTAKANIPITEANSNFGIVNNTEAVDIEIKEVIVAKSKVPVDYQFADEDIAQQIAEYKRTADQNYSGLQSTVSTLDGKITQNKSEQVQTADAIKTRLTSLETYKDGESTRAQAYFEAAKTETAKQITAERSVIARDYTAKSTYTEDVTSIRRTISETKTELGSVTNRTKVVEDDLSGTKTKLEQVKATADTTSRKTAELQNGIDAVTERFDALRTGGKNLILNSAYPTNLEHWSGNMVIANHGFYYNGQKSLFKLQTSSTSEITASTNRFDVKRNTDYTISFYAFASGNVSSADVWFLGRKAGEANDFTSTNMFIGARRLSPVKAEYVTVTFNSGDNDTGYIRFDNNGSTDGNASYLLFGEIMLVEGTIPQTHQFADEDLSNKIAEYKRTADQNYSGLQSTVSTLDGKITQNKSEQVQTADAIKTRLTSLETYKDGESTRAQAYFEAAKTETAKQITAERSVIARDYTAKSTYTEDVTSIRRTISETKTELGSVTNRTKVVEDDLSGTKTKLEQVKVTADSTSRKTAELQSGLDGVTERFENLKIGSRNYFKNSKSREYYVSNSAIQDVRTYIDDEFWQNDTRFIKNYVRMSFDIAFNPALPSDFTTNAYFSASPWYSGGGITFKGGTTELQHFDLKFNLSGATSAYKTDNIFIRLTNAIPFDTAVRLENFNLYLSAVIEDYSQSDVDLESKFAEYKRTADQNYSGLQSTISTLDGKITQNKTEANQTADAIKSRLNSLETYKNAEGTRAQAYFEAAKTETAKQITAERTAITQNYVAKSTYTEDYNGTTRRLTATETVANRADTTANSAVTKATNAQTTADTAKANVTTVTTRLATYQETNDRRVAALETAKSSTDGRLTQLSNKVDQNAQQTRETISSVESKIPTVIGTTNLLRNGQFKNGESSWSRNGTNGGSYDLNHSQQNMSQSGMHFFGGGNETTFFGVQQKVAVVLTTGTKVTVSVSVTKDNNTSDLQIGIHYRKANSIVSQAWQTIPKESMTRRVYKRFYLTFELPTDVDELNFMFFGENGKTCNLYITDVKAAVSNLGSDWSPNPEEVVNDISNAKLDIIKTADGLKLTANKVEGHDKSLTQHTTQITAINNELAAKVSKTEYNELAGRVTGAETNIRVQAGEISKRLTSTQVESAITAKGYQTKAQVDSNITGRGYITSSALQPYATTTVLENKVKETSDSFNRTISAVRLEIPTNASMRNLILKTSDKWGSYTSTNNANSNWCPEICRITLDLDRGVTVGKKLNLFVYISANNVTLDSSSNHIIAIQAAIIKNDGTSLWHADVPFHGQWSQNLKAGNNYYVIKLTKEIKATAYENGATLIVQCRIDGANHVDFHHRAAMITTGDMFPDTWYPAPEDMATVVAFNNISDTVDHHTQTLKDQEGRINTAFQTATTSYQLLQEGGRIYEDLKTVKGQIQQVRDANYATRIETLAGSWAVKNLTSGGQMLNQFNLLANGINHIDGRLTHITGDTLIDRGVIKSAMIGNGQIGTAQIGTIDASQANIINLNVNKLVGLDAAFIKAKIETAMIDWMKGKVISSSDEKMKIHLDTNRIEMNSNAAAIMRKQDGFPIEYINFTNATNTNGTRSSNINIGIDRSQNFASLSNSGDFSGIRIFNNFDVQNNLVDQVEVIGDNIILAHATTNTITSRGWIIRAFNDMHSPTIEPYFNSNTPNVGEWKKNTIIKSGDFWILSDNGKYISVASLLKMLNSNMAHLVNIVGRADVLKHMGDFDEHFAGTDLH